jgi:hypothetical protein
VRRLDYRDRSAHHDLGGTDEPTIGHRLRTMTPISIGRIALPFLALTAACGAAFVSGFPREKQPPVETRAATTAVVSPRSPDSGDEIMPAFDVALIGPTGDAVIAGTAAPGAAVELLRNGESYERSQINSDTSSWSLPGFPLGTMS